MAKKSNQVISFGLIFSLFASHLKSLFDHIVEELGLHRLQDRNAQQGHHLSGINTIKLFLS